jgi:ATP-dependent protease Clp ATPase subunit
MKVMVNEQIQLLDELKRVVEIFVNSECELRPHFILTGSSGSGKSHIISQLAKELDVGFLEINAAQLTKEGTAGNSLSKAMTLSLISRVNLPFVLLMNSTNSSSQEIQIVICT